MERGWRRLGRDTNPDPVLPRVTGQRNGKNVSRRQVPGCVIMVSVCLVHPDRALGGDGPFLPWICRKSGLYDNQREALGHIARVTHAADHRKCMNTPKVALFLSDGRVTPFSWFYATFNSVDDADCGISEFHYTQTAIANIDPLRSCSSLGHSPDTAFVNYNYTCSFWVIKQGNKAQIKVSRVIKREHKAGIVL